MRKGGKMRVRQNVVFVVNYIILYRFHVITPLCKNNNYHNSNIIIINTNFVCIK